MSRLTQESARQVIRPRQGEIAEAEGEKSHGEPSNPRDVKNEGTSGDVNENKGLATIYPTQKTPFLLA